MALAKRFGALAGCTPGKDLLPSIMAFTRKRGADAVLITAGTKSSEAAAQAAKFARDRGKVVAVGDIGMDLPRRAYYEKEIDFRLSRSLWAGSLRSDL